MLVPPGSHLGGLLLAYPATLSLCCPVVLLPRALLGNVSGGLCACVHFFVSKEVPQWVARQV